MIAEEEPRWKLALCPECGKHRMMPETDGSCIPCGRAGRGAVLSAEDIRWVVSYQGPESFIRAAWRLATPDTSTALGLDLRSGAITAHRWPVGECPPVELDDVIILAVCPATRKVELPKLLMAGAEGCASAEDAEEVVVRVALGDGGERFWRNVDAQLANREERKCT